MSVHDKVFPIWQEWKKDNDKEKLSEMLGHFEPMFRASLSKINVPTVPQSVLKTKMKVQALKAFENYNPSKGKINTFVENYLNKTKRTMYDLQNVARIPEARIRKIGTFERTKQLLREQLNREPTDVEISDELGWSLKEIGLLNLEQRKDLSSTIKTTEGEFSIEKEVQHDPFSDVYHNLYPVLNPSEQLVFQYTTGFNNHKVMSGNEIAKKMKVSPSQVSKIKNTISDKITKYVSQSL